LIANLPMTIEQPFGLTDFRSTLIRTLSREQHNKQHNKQNNNRQPVLEINPKGQVFQYLGGLSHPSQIAWRGLQGRTIYDFKNGQFKMPDGMWTPRESLSTEEAAAFHALIHYWESQVLGAKTLRARQ
jgi:hypothetical protein